MNSSAIFKLLRMWILGAILFALRLYQNTNDFDSATGLHTMSAAGTALIVLTIAAIAAAFLFSLGESKEQPLFSEYFPAPKKSAAALILGIFLLAAGGALLAKDLFAADVLGGNASAGDFASCAVAVLVILSVPCLLFLTGRMRRGHSYSVLLLLPSMFFSAFWVLALYLPAANDPVFARYCMPILSAAAAAYAFSLLAGFFRRETSVRMFSFISECAVILCMAAVAERNVYSLLYAGCAVIFSVFSLLPKRKKAE